MIHYRVHGEIDGQDATEYGKCTHKSWWTNDYMEAIDCEIDEHIGNIKCVEIVMGGCGSIQLNLEYVSVSNSNGYLDLRSGGDTNHWMEGLGETKKFCVPQEQESNEINNWS